MNPTDVTPPPLSDLVAYFLKLGSVGFGGPIALVGYMQRDLVEDRKWVSAGVLGATLVGIAPNGSGCADPANGSSPTRQSGRVGSCPSPTIDARSG